MLKKLIFPLLMLALPGLAAPWRLEADLLEYDPKTNQAQAQGAVSFAWQGFELAADRAHLSFSQEKAELVAVKGKGGGFFLEAEQAILQNEKVYLGNSQLTACELTPPEYILYSKNLKLQDGWVYLQGNSLQLFSLPRIPLPSLRFPQDSQLPLPRPIVGNSPSRGYYGGLAIPNFQRENGGGTFTILGSTKRGVIASQSYSFRAGDWGGTGNLQYEDGFWGTLQLQNQGFGISLKHEWDPVTELPLTTLPEVSYRLGKELGGLTIRQNFAVGYLQEGGVEASRLYSESTASGAASVSGLDLAGKGSLIVASYPEERQLGLALVGLLGKSLKLGDTDLFLKVGASYRQVEGSTPFQHDALYPGLDLLYEGRLRHGSWQFAVSRADSLYHEPKFEYQLRHEGHCFYWQLGYREATASFGFELGLL